MENHLKSDESSVAISKSTTSENCVLEGIENLGGMDKFIKEGDRVFIKINLSLPNGFPVIPNFDIIKVIINSCKDVGAKKIYVGSFLFKGISMKNFSELLGIQEYIKNLGAELAFLDNSNYFEQKGIKIEQLRKIKYNNFYKIEVNDKFYLVPHIIIDSDKFISINQVNVNPIFKINLSLLNCYSNVPVDNQEINTKRLSEKEDYITKDRYKQELISNILDIYSIKKPNLAINDLFFLLEGAGPYIYRDSNLKKTNLLIIGDDAVSVDLITLEMLNIDVNTHDLILGAQNRGLGITDLSKIKIFGEMDEKLDVKLCVPNLQDINLINFFIGPGLYCSGCFKQSYHLLNLIKTNLIKDLKYNPTNSFLLGKNPPEPKNLENIILFGDCAINSTKNSDFRKIKKEKSKSIIDDAKDIVSKESNSKKKIKIKVQRNKKILELPGCPPDIFRCIDLILKYYGKKNVPNLALYNEIVKTWTNGEFKEKLDKWEVL
ncbi:MAG: DUF362 domain-containing protein [Promethearchaeota archaeon]